MKAVENQTLRFKSICRWSSETLYTRKTVRVLGDEAQGRDEQIATVLDCVISTMAAKRFALVSWWDSMDLTLWPKGCASSFPSGRSSQSSIWSVSTKSKAAVGWL